MSRTKYEPGDPGNRPVALDTKTGKPYPQDHPVMVAINRAYDAATEREREAFFNVCCLNSRAPADLASCQRLLQAIEAADKSH